MLVNLDKNTIVLFSLGILSCNDIIDFAYALNLKEKTNLHCHSMEECRTWLLCK